MDESLSSSLSDSVSEEISEIASDMLEIGLDSIMDDGILKEVPILSTVVRLYNIGNTLKERHYVKKLAAFLSSLDKGIVDEKKREYYKKVIKDNPKRRDKELEYILLLIDRYIETNKAGILAKVYLSYLDKHVDWKEFVKITEILDQLLIEDINELKKQSWLVVNDAWMPDSLARLIAMGLAFQDTSRQTATYDSAKRYSITSFGTKILFCL